MRIEDRGVTLVGKGGEVSFPGGGIQDKQRQCTEGRVFLVVVKIRAKASRWDKGCRAGSWGGSEGTSPDCRRLAGNGTR